MTKKGGEKMKSFLKTTATLGIFLILTAPFALSQESANEEISNDDILYTYGEVISVMPGQVLIREFDYATGEEIETLYHFNDSTNFETVETGQQILPNDLIDIEFYVSEDGKNIANEIIVDRIAEYEDIME
jgi:hypothetical protein